MFNYVVKAQNYTIYTVGEKSKNVVEKKNQSLARSVCGKYKRIAEVQGLFAIVFIT